MKVNDEGHIEYSVQTVDDPEVKSIVTNSKWIPVQLPVQIGQWCPIHTSGPIHTGRGMRRTTRRKHMDLLI